jgi:gamma-glutamyl:cysteine ligase YbdK (ATP-grasp superfamily)
MNTDKSPIQSLADSKTAKNLASLSSEQRYEMLETLRQTEARDWIRRHRKKIREHGKAVASAWWLQTLSDVVKRRGQKAADDLRRRMNESRKN